MPPTGCGVALFGQQQAQALREQGIKVDVWEAGYPRYLPETAGEYDVVHINFHPGTLGHIQEQHLPIEEPVLSLWSHEWSPEWLLKDKAPSLIWAVDVAQCSDPEATWPVKYWPLPIPDYKPVPVSMIGRPVRIGYTGLRGDGLDWIASICKEQGWLLDKPKGWLSLEQEIDRLSRCHFNVVHSHSAYSGSSSSATLAVAARRPVLVNSGRMLKGIRDLDANCGKELYINDDFKTGVDIILAELSEGSARRPIRLATEHSFAMETEKLVRAWEGLL